jgi:hypothetical protein
MPHANTFAWKQHLMVDRHAYELEGQYGFIRLLKGFITFLHLC